MGSDTNIARLFFGFAAVLLVILAAWAFTVRQNPLLQPNSTVRAMPDIVAFLDGTRTYCCSRSATAKRTVSPRPRDHRALNDGALAYGKVQQSTNELIRYLQTSLDVGFSENAAGRINAQLRRIEAGTGEFSRWADNFLGPSAGAGAGELAIDALIDGLFGWINAERADAAERRKTLQQRLELCRLPDWDSLGNHP